MFDNSLPSRNKFQLPVTRLLVVLTAAAFFEELLVLFLVNLLPPMPKAGKYLLDSILLAILLFPVFYFLVFRPMSRNIAELGQAKENLHTVSVAFESRDPILITDARANILRANKMFLKISGYDLEELIGQNPRMFKTGRYDDDYYHRMWNDLLHKGYWAGETRILDKQGNDFAMEMVITAVKNDRQEITHYVAIYNM